MLKVVSTTKWILSACSIHIMEEDVLNALQTRTAYLPGSFDRDGKIIFIVSLINELQSWQRKCLELSITYLKRSLSDVILQKGVTIIVDAQKTTARINRHHARFIYNLFEGLTVNLYLVKSEGFWEKHVETCTKSQTKGEPIVLSRSRLMKYFDLTSLPEELGGQLQYNYDLWLQQRKSIDEFVKIYDNCLAAMESLQKLLQCNKSIRATEADAELKKNSQMHATVQCSIETVIEMGNRILTRFNEVYSLTPLVNNSKNHFNTTAVKTNATTTAINDHDVHTPVATANGWIKRTLPPDLNCERARIEMRLNEIEKRQTDLRTAWLELIQTVREARELANLEEGVAFVTNWILNTAEQMLNRQTAIGCDVKACENLRSAHDKFELECRETYGFYAELLYKIESYIGSKDSPAYRDLLSQKEFMQFVCRSFATRLERRRNILITSLRFYRLVTEYFDKTTEVFESLVMGGSGGKMEDFTKASGTLQKLKSSQLSLASIERELIKEGEKLSDILSMPVKDALGRDLHIDYSDDICSVREILDTTLARRKIFSDSVELQKLTLEQVTHIYTYEQDACMAIKWLDDLYNVMIKCHSHVGCNIHEIQVQKDELQTFQETGKSIFNYGCQLLEASQTLRSTCKLEVTEALRMQQQLEKTWHSLQAISQEHMTRLRVSAVFHRSVEDYCQQLIELRKCLRSMLQQQQAQLRQQQRSSSSGISSESEFQTQSPPSSAASTNVDQARAISRSMQQQQQQRQHLQQTQQHSSLVDAGDHNAEAAVASEKSLNEQRELLRKYLMEREKLLVEVGRMVRLGRLLKTRLKEPFVLDAATGKRFDDSELDAETDVSCENAVNNAESSEYVNGTSEETSKLEGLNLLKSIVESEQQGQNNNVVVESTESTTSLSEEVAELLKKRLSRDEGQVSVNGEENNSIKFSENEQKVPAEIDNFNEVSENIEKVEEISENPKENEEPDNEPKHTDIEELSNTDQVNDVPNKTVTESTDSFEDHINSKETLTVEVSESVAKLEEISKDPKENKEFDNEAKHTDNEELSRADQVNDLVNKTVNETEDHINSQETSAVELCQDNKGTEQVSLQNNSLEDSNENTENSKESIELFISEEEEEATLNEITDVSFPNREEARILETSEIENEKEVKEPAELFISENEEVSEPKVSELPEKETQESAESEIALENSSLENKELEENVIETPDNTQTHETENENSLVTSNAQDLKIHIENNSESKVPNSRENSPQFSESSKSLSQSSIKENQAYSTTPTVEQDLEETNLCNNSSIVVEDIPSEITTPSPTVDSTISGSSNTSTLDSVNQIQDPSKIVVNPIDNNGLACNAINNKLNDIAEVAESLDAVIRDVQENVQTVEVESNPSPSDKKLGTLRSTSSEDWHSRSTEDDSFATASEGNFTLHSSSSFQTASGRTSSFISCDKNSFDASEADDSTYAFEMPELTSPLNMSFEGSEQSYLSAQQLNNEEQDKERTPTKLSESGSQNTHNQEDDQSSIADVEELHSESVTPTPEQHYDGYHVDSIPVESETELEVAGIVNAPSLDIITEHTLMPMSKTPEVSPSTSNNVGSNQNPLTNTQISVNEANDSNDQQEQENTNNNNNNNKPNAAWRRSKYYENITKQTIKGFL
ncbi:SEC14 domain and spectrin repeat-containing protein 1 [Lucilia cuprina]|nr:SEC14 domain and spectrin repeat-containing protein 1 [Lucilia cuprina]